MKEITWAEFEAVELCVGTILSVDNFSEARKPAYKISIDFGPGIGIKKSSAQLTDIYTAQELVGKQVIGVVNFPVKQIGPMRSECLVTGFYRKDGTVVLAIPERDVPNGTKLG